MWRDRQPGPAGGPVVSASILGGQQGTSVKKPVARHAANRRRLKETGCKSLRWWRLLRNCLSAAVSSDARSFAALFGNTSVPALRREASLSQSGCHTTPPSLHLEPFLSAQVHAPLTFVALVWRLNVVQQACPVGWTLRPEAPERVSVLQCARSFRRIREIRW